MYAIRIKGGSSPGAEAKGGEVTFQISESPSLMIRGPMVAVELVRQLIGQVHQQRPTSLRRAGEMIPFAERRTGILVWDNSLKHSAYMLCDATRYTREWLEQQMYTHWTPDFEDPNE
jgi:hypothetical protein